MISFSDAKVAGNDLPCNPLRMIFPRFFLVALAFCAGCAPPAISVALPEAEIGTPLYVPGALVGAEARFLDVDGFDPAPPSSAAGAGAASSGAAWTARRQVGPRLHLRAESRHGMGEGVALVARGNYRLAETRVRFPQGIDIFTDPADARILGHEISAEIGVSADLPIGDATPMEGFAGAGLSAAWTRTHVTSALLDVRSRERIVTPYLALGLSRALSGGLDLRGDLRLAREALPDLSVSLAARF